jgi:hypothetical protein
VLLPWAERRWGGGTAEDAGVGVMGRPPRLQPPCRSSSRRCALADLLPPVLGAYLHVAPPGSGMEGSFPASVGGHGHECCFLRADLDSTFSAQLVVAGGGGVRLPWRSPSALWG